MKLWIGIAVFAWALPALAENLPTPADLPPTALARQWLDQDPSVVQARSALLAAGHSAAMIAGSANEWTARIAVQRRDYSAPSPASKEWHAQLERPIRINGKAQLDRQLGELEVVVAQARLGEALHEAARLLLNLWIDGLHAAQSLALLREQQTFAQESLRAVQSRKKSGDASALEVSVASLDASDVERQVSLAVSSLGKAQAKLRVRFPQAQLPQQLLSEPQAPTGAEELWLTRVLDAADPLQIAQAQLRKATLSAQRAAADKIADPTVGVFAASEAFRRERIVGFSLSIPVGGSYRSEREQFALQEAEVARAAVDRQRRELEFDLTQTWADATGNTARWKLAQQAAAASTEIARLTQRAYTLGEADLSSLLLARRQLLDTTRAALDLRAEALRANYRLLVDAHLIWDLALE